MPELFQYHTRTMAKAQALFACLADAGYIAQITNLICAEHGPEGYLLVTTASAAEFAVERARIADAYPSTSPAIEGMPDTLTVPDHLPEDFC